MSQRTLVLLLIAATVSVASCKVHDDPNAAAPTVNSVAKNQITNLTCKTNTPEDINDLTLAADESPVDVTTLTPGCVLPGG